MTNIPVTSIAAGGSVDVAVTSIVPHGIQANQSIQVLSVYASGAETAELLPPTPAKQARIIYPTSATLRIINTGGAAATVELNQQ